MQRVRLFWRRVLSGPSARARAAVYEQLAALLQAGFGLRRALSDLAGRERGGARRVVAPLLRAVDENGPLGPAMAARPELFSAIEASLIGTGETSGKLVEALRAVAEHVDAERQVRGRLLAAAAYPALLAHLVLVPAAVVVVPTRGLAAFSAVAVPYLMVLWGTVPLAVSIHVGLCAQAGYARFLTRIPLVGPAFRAGSIARFGWAFAALYEGGAAPDVCLERGADAAENGWLRSDVADAAERVRAGDGIADSLARAESLPKDFRSLLATGEESGFLGESVLRAAGLYEERRRTRIKVVAAVLPAVLVILVAIPIAVLYYQVLVQPILEYL